MLGADWNGQPNRECTLLLGEVGSPRGKGNPQCVLWAGLSMGPVPTHLLSEAGQGPGPAQHQQGTGT